MTNLIPYEKNIRIPASYNRVGLVMCPPGSGVPYVGLAALVLLSKEIAVYAPHGLVITIHFKGIETVGTDKLDGYVEERISDTGGTVLVAPNETHGVKVDYRVGGRLRRKLFVLTYQANAARAWADEINAAVAEYIDAQARDTKTTRNF